MTTGACARSHWRSSASRAGRRAAPQGLGFGLPAVYNPDEIAIMSRALAFAKGDLNPHNFLYPTFFFYALFAWIGGLLRGRVTTGNVASLAPFQSQFFIDPSGIYLAGRRSVRSAAWHGRGALAWPTTV